MNSYGIIAIIMGVIFVGIMAYVFYDLSKPKCSSNQEYVSCDGGAKACYPKCEDGEELLCDQKICVPKCDDDQILYGPTTSPKCSGDYFCGPTCDASSGEVIDCDSKKCVVQCTSGQVVHDECDPVQCSDAACEDGFTWDCDTESCQPDTGTTFFCDVHSDNIPLITTESCDTSDPCCYQNIKQAGACFIPTPNVFWLSQNVFSDSNSDLTDKLKNIDIFVQIFSSKDTIIPYQGDPDYLSSINMCVPDTTKNLPSSPRNKSTRRSKTPTNSRPKSSPRGGTEYPYYGQNYTSKYIRVRGIDIIDGTIFNTVLPPNMVPENTHLLWQHAPKETHEGPPDFGINIYTGDSDDYHTGTWTKYYGTSDDYDSEEYGDGFLFMLFHDQKVVFQEIDCVDDYSVLSGAPQCAT